MKLRTVLYFAFVVTLQLGSASPSAMLRSLSMAQAMAALNLGGGAEPNLLPAVAEGRSLDSAVRDLGLKLTRQKEMVDVLVIDSVSQPDED